MQKKISKIALFVIFCSVFSDMFSASLVSRSLDLAQSIQSLGAVAQQSKNVISNPTSSVTQVPQSTNAISRALDLARNIESSVGFLGKVYPQKFVGPNDDKQESQLWLAAEINEITYVIANATASGYRVPDGSVQLNNLQAALDALPVAEWNKGVYLVILQSSNKYYLVALDSNNHVIARDLLPNVTNVTGNATVNVTWQGSYITNPQTLEASQAFGLTTGSTSDLLPNISLSTSLLKLISMISEGVTYDLKNEPLNEINIQIADAELIFVNTPINWSGKSVISDLAFIPTGSTSFTLEIYGYSGSEKFETSAELQAAITADTLEGFEVQVYDENGNEIGNSIQLSLDLVEALKKSFSSGSFTSELGINSEPVAGSFTYPISLTLENIGNWGQVIYDMNEAQLNEINIDISGTQLTFVSNPWSNEIPPISCLGFIPKGTTSFTIDIYGYGKSEAFETLAELQAAITGGTLEGFGVQVYDEKDNEIGDPIELSPDLVKALTESFSSGSFTSELGINSEPVAGSFTYPISLRLEKIGNWGQVIYDMNKAQLNEINIDISGTPLTFVSSPWSKFPVVSDLRFIPTGMTSFTLDIYGYGKSGTFETLAELQAAITGNTLEGFEVQVYDEKGNEIGNPIQLSSDLVEALKKSFSSTNFSSDLGINSKHVPGSFIYPISLKLENISGWTSTRVIYDMKNKLLTELNISVNGNPLTFISTPWTGKEQGSTAVVPVISHLSFIPAETTEFMLKVYGYSVSGSFDNLSDLQAAIKSKALQGFAAQVYDNMGNEIGNRIEFSPNLVGQLTTAFESGTMPSFNLGVNSADVTPNITGSFNYPIELTLQNIPATNFFVQEVKTSKEFISDYNITQEAPSYPGVSTVTEIHFNVNGGNTGTPNGSGWAGAYAFIKDPWNNISTLYANEEGVAADISSMIAQINAAYAAGSVSIGLIAYDTNNDYIQDLTQTTAKTMVLYIYDQNGDIIGSPVIFPASNAIGIQGTPTFTENSFECGISGEDVGTLKYPVFVTFAKSTAPQPGSIGSGGSGYNPSAGFNF